MNRLILRPSSDHFWMPPKAAREIRPGLLLSLFVALAAVGLASLQRDLTGGVWLEPLVLAILLGAGVRTAWTPDARFMTGVSFSAKMLLEIAVVLLGASVSASTLSSLGPPMIAGVFALVAMAIAVGFGLARLMGLNPRMALLVACGNAICGNSAIAAVAPVIDADGDEVATSISFTAVLGVVVVLALPLLGVLLAMNPTRYGIFAGLTVYAVPQVLAAAAPFGAKAIQAGTLVKLVRVLMLGPVILLLSLLFPSQARSATAPGLGKLLPWFIVGFLLMIAARSLNLIPGPALPVFGAVSSALTVVSMAALGLQTDLKAVSRAGGRAAGAVVLSLAALMLLSLTLIRLLDL
ncbi:putative sulfate exporter family transporter [Caulobacter radicis]|uniref:YeiH family protein n=1 Tax=Caulobacter radicis TaxID=2172650 RepID=UPI000D5689B5|nr:putative sulfate exporter family transporter [Caulobacter radicis]PVM84468.1 putative sulfate exporter family transporter [Caulobacter radicis]